MSALRRTISTAEATYTVVNGEVLLANALAVCRLIDAPSGDPLEVRSLVSLTPLVSVHLASGGWLVLTGRPEVAIPSVGTADQHLAIRVRLADGTVHDIVVTIPMGTVSPFFAPAVAIEPPPTSLEGSVTKAAFPNGPVADARIGIGAIAAPPELLGLRTPLAVGHATGVTVRARAINPSAAATTVDAAAVAGTASVQLASTAGCAANRVLALGPEPIVEHVRILAVDGATRTVTATLPFRRTHPRGEPARAFTLSNIGPATTLQADARAGDGVIVLAAAPASDLVEVVGADREFRATGATTDVDGRWRLDGVRGIGSVNVNANAAGFQPIGPVPISLDYHRPTVVDLVAKT